MVQSYNSKCTHLQLSHLHAECLDLTQDMDLEKLKSRQLKFDIIFTHMVLHHIENVPNLLIRLTSLLKPENGILIITDIQKTDYSYMFHGSGHAHHLGYPGGFDREQLENWFGDAGLIDIQYRPSVVEIPRDVSHFKNENESHHSHEPSHHHHSQAAPTIISENSHDHHNNNNDHHSKISQPEMKQFPIFIITGRLQSPNE